LAKLQEHACKCLAKEYTAHHIATVTSSTAAAHAADAAAVDSTAAALAMHTASTDSDAEVAAATAVAAAENSMHVASLHRAAEAAATPVTAACAADLMRLLQPTTNTTTTSNTSTDSATASSSNSTAAAGRKSSVAQKRKTSVMDNGNSKGSRLSIAHAADTMAAAAATAAALDVLVVPLKEASLKALCGVAAWKLLAVAAKSGSVSEQEVSTHKIQVLWQVRACHYCVQCSVW
jgi:peptidoglycan DL-endopeptidase CwlO